jgi:hypothetical protein
MLDQSCLNNKFTCQVISSLQDFDDVVDEWSQFLKLRSNQYNFWQNPNVIRSEYERKNKNLKLLIIILRNQGIIQCIAPCIIENKKFDLMISVIKLPSPCLNILKVLGNSFVFDAEAHIPNCMDAIFECLKSYIKYFDLINIENLSVPGPLWSYFEKPTSPQCKYYRLVISSPKMEKNIKHTLAERYEDWLSSLSRQKRRGILRQTKNFYKKAPGNVELIRITAVDQVRQFLTWLDMLFPKTWQAKTFNMWNRYTETEVFFYESIASYELLRSYMLMCNDKPVAFLIAFQCSGVCEYHEIGFDQSYNKLSPGSVLLHLVLQDMYDHNKPRELDFGFGENEYKKRLGNTETVSSNAYILIPNLWRNIVYLQRFFYLIENKTRRFLVSLNLDNFVRRVLKRRI